MTVLELVWVALGVPDFEGVPLIEGVPDFEGVLLGVLDFDGLTEGVGE